MAMVVYHPVNNIIFDENRGKPCVVRLVTEYAPIVGGVATPPPSGLIGGEAILLEECIWGGQLVLIATNISLKKTNYSTLALIETGANEYFTNRLLAARPYTALKTPQGLQGEVYNLVDKEGFAYESNHNRHAGSTIGDAGA